MNKKYTLDTPLDPEAMEYYEVDEPVTSMRIAGKVFNPIPFEEYFEGVRYQIGTYASHSEILVDMDNKYGNQKGYGFKTFEELLNAHLVVTNPDLVVGDIIMYYNDMHKKNRPNS